ncbi:MAG TPA: hypothetical protein VFB39_05890 [Solirubrobacteraceae bacterium]|nr:hypothetical protein [Solirubrobacteraceae bacterium]
MPTDIYFAGENVRVQVDEDPGQVAEAFAAARGLPFPLTVQDGRQSAVYVNPLTVAFWSAAESGPPPEPPQDPAPPTKKRQVVTDIWGRPIRTAPPH